MTHLKYSQEIRINTFFFSMEKSYFGGKFWKFTRTRLLAFLSVNLILHDLWKETSKSDRPVIRDAFVP